MPKDESHPPARRTGATGFASPRGGPAALGPAGEVRTDAILLLSCYELGHPPIGLASPLGFLERAGFRPGTIDLSIEGLDAERVARARLIGISVPMHTALRLGVRAAERIREINPAAHICMYGLYASLNSDYLLRRHADSVLGGESEGALVELAERIAGGSGAEDRFLGPILQRLHFAGPSRLGLPPLERYAKLERDGRTILAGYVEATRGCAHTCLHCPITPVYEGRFFVVPREIVMADIRAQIAAGAGHITFGDPDFLNAPRHSLDLARTLHAEFPQVSFDFTTKVEHLLEHRALLPEFARLGAAFVVSAVESLSDTVLGHLEKGHTRRDVAEALKVVREAGLPLRPTWVPFTPWSMIGDLLDILDFVEREGLACAVDPVQFSIRLLVPPGSALLRKEAIRPFLGPLDQAAFMHPWTHPDPRMDALQKWIARKVEEDAAAGVGAQMTIDEIRAEAYRVADRAPAEPAARRPAAAVPRLTEPWFC